MVIQSARKSEVSAVYDLMQSGAMQLAEALKGNATLKSLDIGGNNIGPEGIKVLLEALRGNNTLRSLELGYNPIGEEGAKHLADVVKYDLAVGAPIWSLNPSLCTCTHMCPHWSAHSKRCADRDARHNQSVAVLVSW